MRGTWLSGVALGALLSGSLVAIVVLSILSIGIFLLVPVTVVLVIVGLAAWRGSGLRGDRVPLP